MAKRLTSKEYWNARHARDGKERLRGKGKPAARLAEFVLAKIRGKKSPGHINTYSDYVLWNLIYGQFLPKRKGLKVLEVGSAPGEHLVALHRRFGYTPFGVEYSDIGAELNRRMFRSYGLDPANVIHADFFSDEFATEHRGHFDVVLSRGFVEHFSEPHDVVARHVGLLRHGGILIITIPNLRGINYLLAWLFNSDSLRMHNLEIMRRESFRALFERENLAPLYCGYYGIFDFDLFEAEAGSVRECLRRCCKAFQLLLNILFRILFRRGGGETSFFSPYLISVGTKK